MTSVLIIEDQGIIRLNIAEALGYEGFATLEAENGRVGVQMARDHLPDLIVCDIMMPELDGYGVLLELRSDALTATIPFLFLTAIGDRSDMRKGMELGADDYLTKPFEQRELVAAINTILEKQRLLKKEYAQRLEMLRENILLSLPHELRTPLTAIVGYGVLLEEDYQSLEPEQVQNMAHYIVKAGNRLFRLIENYLIYAQIEINSTSDDWVNELRNTCIPHAADVIGRSAEQKAEEVGRKNDLILETVNADVAISEDHLAKIIEELVDNAFKFSEPGTLVQVTTTTDDDTFALRISDRGRGMTVEQINNVGAYMQFERKLYEQQGMGLGLILAKRFTELHGGTLSITSSPGQGTNVAIELRIPHEHCVSKPLGVEVQDRLTHDQSGR